MKTFILILTLFCATSLLSGCEDFLDEVPQTERTEANFYRTSADFYNAVVGMYGTLKNGGLYGNGTGALHAIMEMSSDNTEFGSTRQPINQYTFEFDDLKVTIANTDVNAAWSGHYAGISRANAILDRLPEASIPQADKDRFEGEARFMRALFYFNLVRLFGEVQLVTSEISSPYGANALARSAASEVYALIVSDLQMAGDKLPPAITAGETGRASMWAAKSLLGKVYLALQQYSDAATLLKEVIDSKSHNLLPEYASVFSAVTPATANKEYIFTVQYKSGQIGQGSSMWSSWAPFNAGVPLLGANGGTGGGFNRPTADIEAAYEPGDVRKEASMLSSYKNARGQDVPERYVVKFRQQGALSGDSEVDFPIIRYADVLLMYAEALNEQGQTAEALTYLNQIRSRARLAEKNVADQAELRLAIEQERRVELAFEGHRWPDLVRTGRFIEVLGSKGYQVAEFKRYLPIPQREIDLNKSLTQNEGY